MQRTEAKDILNVLSNLDLSEYPYDYVKHLIMKLGKFGVIVHHIFPGQRIFRARPNDESSPFNTVHQLSFKPAEANTTYSRASTPYQTMFYGCMLPSKFNVGELDNARLIGACEVVDFLRDPRSIYEGIKTITFGKWIVTM